MSNEVKHIRIDEQPPEVVEFILSLDVGQETILELAGRNVLRVSPVPAVDRERLKQAILARRDESRVLNADWQDADRDVWDHESRSID
jgi:hypothetical protein